MDSQSNGKAGIYLGRNFKINGLIAIFLLSISATILDGRIFHSSGKEDNTCRKFGKLLTNKQYNSQKQLLQIIPLAFLPFQWWVTKAIYPGIDSLDPSQLN